MSRRDVRVVIGEGGSSRRGLLRFVLEGEGFEVVGEADRHADLVHVVALLRPDVVVLDDGIGVAAVGMVREIAPHAKIVLVWPQAVVPIGGDARVEPAHVVHELGPAVQRVAAALIGPTTQTYRRPDWVDRVRKDPTALRELLTRAGASTTAGFSVSQLQRRIADAERRERERAEPAAAVTTEEAAAVVPLPDASTSSDRDRARRIGTIALGAAAASAALVFALSVGNSRIPVLVLGERPGLTSSPSPPVISPAPSPPGGGGEQPGGHGDHGGGRPDQQDYGPAPTEPTSGPGSGTSPVDGGGDRGPLGGDGATDGTGDTSGDGGEGPSGLPGASAEHNPYGGPPGILGFTPRPWMFLDGTPGDAGEQGRAGDQGSPRGDGWGLGSSGAERDARPARARSQRSRDAGSDARGGSGSRTRTARDGEVRPGRGHDRRVGHGHASGSVGARGRSGDHDDRGRSADHGHKR